MSHSIADSVYNLRYFKDRVDLTLEEIASDRVAVRERHKKLTRDNGSYEANRAMRALRAAYNLALKVDDSLPANLFIDIAFNREKRRDEALELDGLPD